MDKDATAGQQISGLIMDYQDPQGNSFTDTEYYPMTVKSLTFIDNLISYWYVFAIIAIILVIMVVRRILKFASKAMKGGK